MFSLKRSKWFRVTLVAIFGLIFYTLVAYIFAIAYFNTNSISLTGNKNHVSFGDAFYFSFVSFLTIGYGDIAPTTELGRQILFIESLFSLFYNALFPSFLFYFILKRPYNVFFTKNIYIQHTDNIFRLATRFGNNGTTLLDVKVILQVFKINERGIRTIDFEFIKHYHVIEKTSMLYRIRLDDKENEKLLKRLQDAIIDNNLISIRISLWGTDASTGTPMGITQYYNNEKLQFCGKFKDVIYWKGRSDGSHSKPKWSNFDKVEPISESVIEDFKHLEAMS